MKFAKYIVILLLCDNTQGVEKPISLVVQKDSIQVIRVRNHSMRIKVNLFNEFELATTCLH